MEQALYLLHELQTISERINDENALVTLERYVIDGLESSFSTAFNDRLQITHQQTWMCLRCGTKVLVDAEVDLDTIGFEPATASLGKVWRFGRFRKTQYV